MTAAFRVVIIEDLRELRESLATLVGGTFHTSQNQVLLE